MTHALIPIPIAFGLGVLLTVIGVLVIIFRQAVRESVRRNQAAVFGEAFANSRKAGPNAMIGPGVIAIFMGMFMVVYSIVRFAIGATG